MKRDVGDHLGDSEIINFLVAEGIIKPLEGFCMTYIVEKPFEVRKEPRDD